MILKVRVVLKAEVTREFTFEGDLIVDDPEQAYQAGVEFWTLAQKVAEGMDSTTGEGAP